MGNLDTIAAWTAWAKEHDVYPGDTYPSEEANVDFWFAAGGDQANEHFYQFASTGDGSLLAIYSEAGKAFDTGPVVLLGGEGDVHVLGDGVLSALAVVARAGADVLDSAVAYGPDGPADDRLVEWLGSRGIAAIDDIATAVAAAEARHPKVATVIETLNGGG